MKIRAKDINSDSATNGYVLTISGGNVVWAAAAGGGGGASTLDDLTDVVITSAATGQILKHNGTNFVNVTPVKGDVGLGNVDNTSDANKPISTAQQTALDGKQAASTNLDWLAVQTPASHPEKVLAVNATGDGFEFVSLPSAGLANIVEDTTPQLGGDLDVNGNIITVVSGDLKLKPTTGGAVILNSVDETQYVYVGDAVVEIGGDVTLYSPDGTNTVAVTDTGTAVVGGFTVGGVDVSLDGHDHDADYAAIGHNHDSAYAPKNPVVSSQSLSGTQTVDMTGIDELCITLTGNLTLTLSNLVSGKSYKIHFIQDGTGSRTVTLNSQFKFGTDVTAYTATTTASKRDLFGIWSDGTNAYVIGVAKGY